MNKQEPLNTQEAHKVAILNPLSEVAVNFLKEHNWNIVADLESADALIVRSRNLGQSIPAGVRAIARAGVGVNNIPVELCTERGVVVFNTPGANANSVKELVIAALLISSRSITSAIEWARSLKGDNSQMHQKTEEQKRIFLGTEISGKTLGVIGLGAIGVMVSNAALALGMKVIGYDPFISVRSAWGLSHNVQLVPQLKTLYSNADWITIHIPLTPDTKGFINAESIRQVKKGVRLLNFARGELVDTAAVSQALSSRHITQYITDFPDSAVIDSPHVITVPHLGASTKEAEENCAYMAVQQLHQYFVSGTIVNSVNFPTCEVAEQSSSRILIATHNIPNMMGQITSLLAQEKINIQDLTNRHRGSLAYNIIDTNQVLAPAILKKINAIPGVIFVRLVP